MKFSSCILIKGVVDRADKVRSNSVLIPLAEYNTLLTAIAPGLKEVGTSLLTTQALQELGVANAMLYLFLLESGCRVSEALSIGHTDILMLGDAKILGKKGSHTRIVHTSLCRAYLIQCRANCADPFSDTSYDCFYKAMIRKGIGAHFGNNCNKSVSHYFRHIYVLLQKLQGVDIEVTQRDLGHKSAKSTQEYAKKIKDGKRH